MNIDTLATNDDDKTPVRNHEPSYQHLRTELIRYESIKIALKIWVAPQFGYKLAVL